MGRTALVLCSPFMMEDDRALPDGTWVNAGEIAANCGLRVTPGILRGVNLAGRSPGDFFGFSF
ncbi:MAG TPA: hypothetical protein PLK99_10775 [Burkholderiales bacterium]|nr:hypothetical protein [Burkholderiales bacterium]